jgi:hypothetical protein
MTIDSTSSATTSQRPSIFNIRQDLNALQTDLQAGNVSQAKTDFASLLNDSPRLSQALAAASGGTSSTATGSTGSTTLGSSLSSLSTALQAGDASGASSALTSLQQTLSASGHHHHHHHHHHGGPGSSTESTAVQNDMQSLSSALQSGDLSSAQAAFAQLQKDEMPAPTSSAISGTSGSTSGGTV